MAKKSNNKRHVLGLSLQPRLMERLENYAEEHGLTKTQVAMWALDQFLTIHDRYETGLSQPAIKAMGEVMLGSVVEQEEDGDDDDVEEEDVVEEDVEEQEPPAAETKKKRGKRKDKAPEPRQEHATETEALLVKFNDHDQQIIKDAVAKVCEEMPTMFPHTLHSCLKKWMNADPFDVVTGCEFFLEEEDMDGVSFADRLSLLQLVVSRGSDEE